MKVKNVKTGKIYDIIFGRLDVNIIDKTRDRLRFYFSDTAIMSKFFDDISLFENNKFVFYDEEYGFEYNISSHTNYIQIKASDDIAAQYSSDIPLCSISMTGESTFECVKSHTDIILDLIPTFKCNMKCDYCFQHKFHDDTLMHCSKLQETYSGIAEYLKNMIFKQVNLFGGELSIDMERCELADDIVNKHFISEYTNRKKVFTNAKEFNIEFADFIKQDVLKNLYISVSSLNTKIYDPRHVDVSLMMSNIKRYVDYLGESKIKAVIIIDEVTLDYLEDTVNKLRDVGVHRFIIKLENRLNGKLFKQDDSGITNKYRSIIKNITEQPGNMVYIRNDVTQTFYLSFLIDKEQNEGKSVCEMCLCTQKNPNSPMHLGVEDMVYSSPLKLYSIINNGMIIYGDKK